MVQIPLNWQVILLGSIIAQGVFASILLFSHPRNHASNRLLSLLLLAFSLWLLDPFNRVAGVYQQDPDYYFMPIFYSLSFGPLLYAYVGQLTQMKTQYRWYDGVHLLPVVFQAGLYWFLHFSSYDLQRWFWFEVHRPYTYPLEFYLSLISLFGYTLASLRLLRQYQTWLKDHFSELSRLRLSWLQLVLWLMALLCLLWMVDLFLRLVWNVYPDQSFAEVMMGVIVLFLAAGSLRQMGLREVTEAKQTMAPTTERAPELDARLTANIKHVMEEEQLYLQPQLTLKDFAKAMNSPPRTVSEHLNHGLQQSFIDFVNTYRVAAFQRKLEEGNSHLTLLGLALESGFNSKSTFNRVFKKHTGQSPQEYAKKVQNTH